MMKKLISLAVAVFLFFLLLSQFSMSFAKSNLAFFFFVPGEGEEEEDINVSGELCCPDEYQDEYCPKILPWRWGWDPNTECCQYRGLGFWRFENKIPCEVVVELTDVTCQNGEGIDTALGCVPTKSTSAFIKYLLNFAIGIGGGIAFLLMIFGGLQIILSGGNPDRIKAGKEIITAAIGGLLLIIFSVFILRVIGVDILQIPGFGE